MENHLTQREVAEMYYNCTAGHLNNILAGRRGISKDFAQMAAKVHGIHPWDLMKMTPHQFRRIHRNRFKNTRKR